MRTTRRAALLALLAVFLYALPSWAQVQRIDDSDVDRVARDYSVGLVSPGRAGERLVWAGASGSGFGPGTILYSPRTRTPGLIAFVDAPLGDIFDPDPDPRPISAVPGTVAQLRRFKSQVEASEAAKTPLLIVYGAIAGAAVFAGAAALRWRDLKAAARAALTFATAGTLALWLPAPFALAPVSALVAFVVASVALALVAELLLGRRGIPGLLLLLLAVVAVDTVFRLGLVALSPLSGYYIAGIRYYGIGNEYMGLLIGACLMAVPRRILTPVGVALILLLGLPMLGANAGGAMAATVGVAFVALPDKLPLARRAGVSVLLAVLVAALLALVDRMLPGAAQSHIGQAAGKGPSVWAEIIARKLAMNLRLGVAVPTLAAAVALVPLWLWMARASGGAPIRSAVAASPDLALRLRASLAAAAAAIAFNDSGIVAALLLLAPVTVTLLDRALERLQSPPPQ